MIINSEETLPVCLGREQMCLEAGLQVRGRWAGNCWACRGSWERTCVSGDRPSARHGPGHCHRAIAAPQVPSVCNPDVGAGHGAAADQVPARRGVQAGKRRQKQCVGDLRDQRCCTGRQGKGEREGACPCPRRRTCHAEGAGTLPECSPSPVCSALPWVCTPAVSIGQGKKLRLGERTCHPRSGRGKIRASPVKPTHPPPCVWFSCPRYRPGDPHSPRHFLLGSAR